VSTSRYSIVTVEEKKGKMDMSVGICKILKVSVKEVRVRMRVDVEWAWK